MTFTRLRARRRLLPALASGVVMAVVAALVAGCGVPIGTVPVLSAPVCARPDQPPGTETQVPVNGFVRSVAVVGSDVWVAVRGGVIAKLDAFCDITLLSINVGRQVWPKTPTDSMVDFTAFTTDGNGILWAVLELLGGNGSPIGAAVVRFDAHSERVTATLPLALIGYPRTTAGLAVDGDTVWVADAQTPGTVARLDPNTAAVVQTVRTPVGAQPANEDVAVDDQGSLWVSDGPGTVDVLDSTGVRQDTVQVADAAGPPDLAPDGDVVWIGAGTLHQVSDTTHARLAAAPVALTMLAPVGVTVWGVVSGTDAVEQVAADGTTVLADYPVLGDSLALVAQEHDLWRVDFAGVLHHIAV